MFEGKDFDDLFKVEGFVVMEVILEGVMLMVKLLW